jgi:hypothetical protein
MSATATRTDQKATPFHFLAAMQERHAEMVREVGKDVLSPPNARAVTDFIRDAAATGTVLDASDDRAAAQGLINFWTARLSSAARAARDDTPEARPVAVPDFEETLLAPFDPATIQAAITRADAWLKSLPEQDQATARRVMLRLVRLPTEGKGFDPVPLIRGAFYDLDDPKRVNAAIDGLAAAGVARVMSGDSRELDRVALRSPQLLEEWATYAGWLEKRRQFRQKVVEWHQQGQHASGLLKGDDLEEAKSYFDRDAMEREFIEQSRRREWRANERNRILKWVFGGLALAAVVGWTLALFGLAKANNERRTLAEKQELTNIRLFVRGLGELAAADDLPARQKIAKARWEALLEQFRQDPKSSPFLDLNLKELHECVTCRVGPTRLSADDLAEIRRLRNSVITNEQLRPTILAMRAVSYDMVELSAEQAVAELKAAKAYSAVEAYMREFWTQYWGEMLLVEGPEVEDAMVSFGRPLGAIQAGFEKPDPSQVAQIQAVVGRHAGGKGRQLTTDLSSFRLNVASLTQLDERAARLGVPDAERDRIQNELCEVRQDAAKRPITNQTLVNELAQRLAPLLAALDNERAKPVTLYIDRAAR